MTEGLPICANCEKEIRMEEVRTHREDNRLIHADPCLEKSPAIRQSNWTQALKAQNAHPLSAR